MARHNCITLKIHFGSCCVYSGALVASMSASQVKGGVLESVGQNHVV